MANANVTELRREQPEPNAPASTAGKTTDRAGSRRKLIRWSLMALGPLLVVLVGAWWYMTSGRYVSTDDAFVKTDLASISAQVPGQVATVYVKNNQTVQAGQVLFELDASSYKIALDQAEANLSMTKDRIASLRANYREKIAGLKSATDTTANRQREFERQTRLRTSGASSQQQYEQAQLAYQQAQRNEDATREQIAAIEAQLGGKVDTPTEELGAYRAALAQRDDAALALARTKIVAPAAGVLANVTVRPGDYISAGQPVFNLAETANTWVEANFKETQLEGVAAGQPATIKVDAYPGKTWHATVESLSPASGNEFSVLPAENSSGNWIKVVQRIPVRLSIEPQADAPTLRAGMSVTVEIDTKPENTRDAAATTSAQPRG
ncbi:MAG TPA: HlyD family secretion protein [Alphaproteobacteria bacterium]|nr:HlyD family secretion protein [Alphaproteobacteria bacterium]